MNLQVILTISAALVHVSGYKVQRVQRYEQSLDEFEFVQGVPILNEDNEERTAMAVERLQEREGSLCDLSGYGGNLNGQYQLRIWNHHNRYVSQVYCTNDVCTPLDTAITDACNYLCGSDTCPPPPK